MSVLKNKHLVVAMIVAPVLAVGSYFVVGHLYGEKPQPAAPGQSYQLVEKPNCRYDSGRCGLVNADFELEVTIEPAGSGAAVARLSSVFPLEGVMLALVGAADEAPPAPMRPDSDDGTQWSLDLPEPVPGEHRLRLVAAAEGAFYYGDVSTEFTRR